MSLEKLVLSVLTVVSAIFSSSSICDAKEYMVYVWLSGKECGPIVKVSSGMKIEMENGNLRIADGETERIFDIYEVEKFEYKENMSGSVFEVTEVPVFSFEKGILVVSLSGKHELNIVDSLGLSPYNVEFCDNLEVAIPTHLSGKVLIVSIDGKFFVKLLVK